MDQNTIWMHQHTECQPISVGDWQTYRIDIHVSKSNTWIGVWRKLATPVGTYYFPVVEMSCGFTDSLINGVIVSPEPCPEFRGQTLIESIGGVTYLLDLPDDATTPTGDDPGIFIGSSSLGQPSGKSWKVSKVYIAHWDT
jgi:hypothetical protein